MENKNLSKALDIITKLVTGEEVGKQGAADLYDEFVNNGEVYDITTEICKKLNLVLIEHENALYACAGEQNRVFGYTTDEMKKEMGVRLNRELYLCYYIIYNIITQFYNDTGSSRFTEYIKPEEIIQSVDSSLTSLIHEISIIALSEVEEHSFKTIALIWEDLPVMSNAGEEVAVRAARNSKLGFVKMTLNFLVKQDLMLENDGRYYPKKRFRAMTEEYFETYKGRLYEIMRGGV